MLGGMVRAGYAKVKMDLGLQPIDSGAALVGREKRGKREGGWPAACRRAPTRARGGRLCVAQNGNKGVGVSWRPAAGDST